jgi:hypothetical protein
MWRPATSTAFFKATRSASEVMSKEGMPLSPDQAK